jgi:hypothetical protein
VSVLIGAWSQILLLRYNTGVRSWLLCVVCALGPVASGCSDPPGNTTTDASSPDAEVPSIDAAIVDAPVVDAPSVSDAANPDAVIDAARLDATIPDADTSEDATAGSGLSMLSDDFETGTLDPSWQLFRDSIVDIDVSAGALHLSPMFLQMWFNFQQGAFVYKNASGNFKVTATVRARLDSDPSMPATGVVEMGGLMARKDVALGAGMQEDYVFVAVGSDGMQNTIETKSTNNGMSFFMAPAFSSSDAELRLCRIADMFYMYSREVGQTTWIEAMSIARPDIPGTVQLGAMVCANNANPDLRASFDELVFAEAIDQADCLVD